MSYLCRHTAANLRPNITNSKKMESQNKIVIIRLLFISFGLLTTQASRTSRSLQQYDDSPSPLNYVSFPPTPSANPPISDAPTQSPPTIDFPEFNIMPIIPDNVDKRLRSVCDSTDHPDLCLGTVIPSLSKGRVDSQAILQASIKATSTLAKMALGKVEVLAGQQSTSPEVASVLRDCKESYSSVVDDFEEVVTALAEGDIGTMNSKLSGLMMEASDCEDGFQSLGEKSPLSEYAERLTEMTSNCLAVVSVMN